MLWGKNKGTMEAVPFQIVLEFYSETMAMRTVSLPIG
jgi:hypothetical protein